MLIKMRSLPEQQLVIESPEHYNHPLVQEYIQTELYRPSKQWIQHVLQGLQEAEHIKLQTDDFLLLPDTERVNRYWSNKKPTNNTSCNTTLNWLAIVKDSSLKTLRDLRGEHIPMLEKLRDQCLQKIQEDTGLNIDEVMVYLHYHPSVYQIHIHFAYPYMQYNHKDVYRIHSINTVLNNLHIDPTYYQRAHLQVSVNKESVLYKIIKGKIT